MFNFHNFNSYVQFLIKVVVVIRKSFVYTDTCKLIYVVGGYIERFNKLSTFVRKEIVFTYILKLQQESLLMYCGSTIT